MKLNISSIIIAILAITIVGLIYFGVVKDRKLAQQDNLIKASTDTLHKFKTTIGNQGAYISTLVGDKNSLIEVLQSKIKQDSASQVLIDSLKQDKHIQSATIVTTNTNSKYSHKVDSTYKAVNFKDSISTKWYSASIKVKNDSSSWNIKTKDELVLTNNKKPNKGLFSGSTLTTYAESMNKDEDISGITSISTVVDKRKPRLGSFLGPSLLISSKGNIKAGLSLGVGLTF